MMFIAARPDLALSARHAWVTAFSGVAISGSLSANWATGAWQLASWNSVVWKPRTQSSETQDRKIRPKQQCLTRETSRQAPRLWVSTRYRRIAPIPWFGSSFPAAYPLFNEFVSSSRLLPFQVGDCLWDPHAAWSSKLLGADVSDVMLSAAVHGPQVSYVPDRLLPWGSAPMQSYSERNDWSP